MCFKITWYPYSDLTAAEKRLSRYLQPYLQPYVNIASTALNKAFKIPFLKLEFVFLDIRFQGAFCRAAKRQPQHTAFLAFAALGFKGKKMFDVFFTVFIAAGETFHAF